MPVAVTDARSNPNDQIAHAANVLKKSPRLRKLFEAICRGGKKPKSVAKVMETTGFDQVATLQLGGKLADQQLVHKHRLNGKTFYEKDRFYAANRAKILSLATNANKLSKLPTKYSPKTSSGPATIRLQGAKIQISEITCDDCDQFSKVKKIAEPSPPSKRISESAFKAGVQKLIGERGKFQDWGGEKNDLFTSRVSTQWKAAFHCLCL